MLVIVEWRGLAVRSGINTLDCTATTITYQIINFALARTDYCPYPLLIEAVRHLELLAIHII